MTTEPKAPHATRGRRALVASLIALALAVVAVSPADAARGYARVERGTLVADNGNLLRGVFYDPDTTGGPLPDPAIFLEMKKYGFNALHVYGGRPCGSDPANKFDAKVMDLVNLTRQHDLYMILTVGQDCVPNPTPLGGGLTEHFTYDMAFSLAFWDHYAPKLKTETHVVLEITNEPYWTQTSTDVVNAQNPPQHVIDLQAAAYDKIRDLTQTSLGKDRPIPILLFSYGGFTNGSQAKNDWARVNTALAGYGRSLKDAAVAFHTYGTGSLASFRAATQTARSGVGAIPLINTEMLRGNNPSSCTVPGKVTEAPCLYPAQVRAWEEEDISWLSFLKIDKLVGGQSVGDLLDADDYEKKVVPQMDYGTTGHAIVWIPDDPTASWPVRRATEMCGRRVAIKSVSTARWAEVGGDLVLRANSTTTPNSTRFDVTCDAVTKRAKLRSVTSGKWLNPRAGSTATSLVTNANPAQAPQHYFDLLVRRDGRLMIRSTFNGSARPSWRFVAANTSNHQLFDDQTVFIPRARFKFKLF